MRKLILSTALLVAIAGTAVAQDAPEPPMPPQPEAGMDNSPPPPPAGAEAPRPGPRGPADRGPEGRRPPPPERAAHFRIEDGKTKIDIKCADGEPMKACADILSSVLDRLGPPPKR